jgi:hypothetical protein
MTRSTVVPANSAAWQGTAVPSIAEGRTVGVVPGAGLYFIGLGLIWSNQPLGNWFSAARRGAHASQHQALTIRRILEIQRLKPERKIRVIEPNFPFCFCILTFAHFRHFHFRCWWYMWPLISLIGTLHFRHVTWIPASHRRPV